MGEVIRHAATNGLARSATSTKLVRPCAARVVLLLLLAWAPRAAAQTSSQDACLAAFGMGWATAEDAKSHLVMLAKRQAVSQLFGDVIRSLTQMESFTLTRDAIEDRSAGFVRVQGSPSFRNGSGFGEICVHVEAFITDDDAARFRARAVQKRVCLADPRLSLGEIRATAERQARVQALRDYEPRLEGIDDDSVVALLHEASTEGGGFVPDTTTYCVTARGVVYPIELVSVVEQPRKPRAADVRVECWGQDLTDGHIGGWKSSYPHCVLDDGGGDRNAIYDGSFTVSGGEICFAMSGLRTEGVPRHLLAVGFAVDSPSSRSGSPPIEVEMTRFTGTPRPDAVRKCVPLP